MMVARAGVHQAVVSRKVPRPTGPYAQAIKVSRAGDMLFVSGQLPYEVPHGSLFCGAIKRQAELVFGHLKHLVLDARFNLAEIVKVTIYLTDLKNEAAVDAVYQSIFGGLTPPARVLVEVSGLRGGASIEVEAIAVREAPAPAAAPAKKEAQEEDEGMY
jgi:2-iminobutanoate/2-iminopropanoate deaminase